MRFYGKALRSVDSTIGGSSKQRVKRETCLRRLRALYGSNPAVYAEIIEDLQTTQIEKAWVDSKKISVEKLLLAMNFLKCCQSEEVRSGPFKVSEKTVRKWGWFYTKKIRALKKLCLARKLEWRASFASRQRHSCLSRFCWWCTLHYQRTHSSNTFKESQVLISQTQTGSFDIWTWHIRVREQASVDKRPKQLAARVPTKTEEQYSGW